MGQGPDAMTDQATDMTGQDEPEETTEIVESIEETRNEMTETVEAIGEKLDPARIVQDAKETVREATVGKVETMAQQATGFAGEAGNTIQQAGGGLVETIKRNPLPAAMAAFGIGWLATHRANTGNGGRSWQQGAYGQQGEWGSNTYPGYRVDSDFASRDRDGGTSPGEVLGAAADKVGQATDRLTTGVSTSTQGIGERVGEVMDTNPLAAGALAVAVGAAIGMALPPSRMERDVLGTAGQRVLQTVEDTTTEQMQRVREEATTQ
jgi:hypothetical protein